MPLITPSKSQQEYDVIVVGSGAAGGMSAYLLAMQGYKVLMLEAGRNYDPVTETPMFLTPQSAPLRNAATPDKPFGFYDATVDGGWQVPGEPYTNAADTNFMWWRARMLGGRTNHWGRISLRMGEYDFKPKSRDGFGLDWPLDYEDLAPYYDKVELLIGVYGGEESLENTPASPKGVLQPPPAPRAFERFVGKHAGKLGVPFIPSHLAILTQTQNGPALAAKLHPDNPNAKYLAQHAATRAACFWATDCGRGCSIKANFQSTTVLIPPAILTGNLDVMTDAMVREVTVNDAGKATGVHYIDKITRQDKQVKAKVVILAASGCESARILLNSKSKHFPNGAANGSGLVGKYLMDTVGAKVVGQFPALEGMPPMNDDGASAMHVYAPWWGYQDQKKGKLDFPRGYHIEISGGKRMPAVGMLDKVFTSSGSFGAKLKDEAKRYYGSFVNFAGRGEMIPNEDSYCEIDPEVVDQWGIPVLKFHWKWSEHEVKQAAHMKQTFKDIIQAGGGRVHQDFLPDGKNAIYRPGEIIHEVGTTCMGAKNTKSVLNEYCQSWEISNLFVTDGGAFASNADKNPTLSIMALAWRSMDYLVDAMKKGEI